MPRIMVSLLPGGLLVVQNQMHLYPSDRPPIPSPIPKPIPSTHPPIHPSLRPSIHPFLNTLKIPPSKAWGRLHLRPFVAPAHSLTLSPHPLISSPGTLVSCN